MKRILVLIFVLGALILATPQLIAEDASPANQLGGEAIFTDQVDYMPEDTVHITGTGFEPGAQVEIRVTRPDGSIVTGDGSLTPGSDSVVTDADGNLVYDYLLDGIEGTYIVDVIGAEDLILASTTFTDAIPATVDLYADAARTIPKQAFERGDTVYARATATAPDLVAKYRFRLYEPGGTLHSGYPTTCLTPSSGNLDDSHQILQTDPLSILAGATPVTGGRWTYQLRYYTSTTNCTNQTGGANLNKTFYVYQAYAYTNAASRNACVSDATCGSPTPRPVVTPGSTVYLVVRGFTANRAACGIQFVRPDGSIACTIGPFMSDANGAYSFDYPSGSCPPISNSASDIGCWTLNVSADYGPGFHPQFTANIDAFCVKAPLTVTTAVHDASHNDITNGSVALGAAVHDTATISGTISGLDPAPVTFKFFENCDCSGDGTAVSTDGSENGATKSAAQGPLHAGDYSFKASVAGNDYYFGDDSDCEPFTVDKGTVSLATTIYNAADDTVIPLDSHVPLGTSAYDKVTVTGETVFFDIADVTYEFDGAAAGSGAKSDTKGPLHAGNHAFQAFFDGNDDYNKAESELEPFVVDKANTTSATEVHNPDCNSISYVLVGTQVHDKIIISGKVDDFEIGGTADFTLYKGGTCSGDIVSSWPDVEVDNGVAETPGFQLNDPGIYSYKATYDGDNDYKGSVATCETFYVLPKAAVTSSSLCEFDIDGNSENGQQFRLIYTPDMAWSAYKLSASNPGQFYYNAFVNASGPTTLTISVPYPFVTQGAMPVHVYSDLTPSFVGGKWCFTPGTEIDAEDDQIVLDSNYDAFGEIATIEVDFDYTGIAYVAVHLDYGLKKTYAYSKNSTNLTATGIAGTPAAGKVIISPETYTFSDSATGSDTVQSINEFKKDPGIGGLVLKSGSGDPIAGATVEIWQGTKKLATVKTDADGWYMWNYKYTGKAATFTVKLPAYSLSQTVTLKSNGYLVVNFAVP